MTFYVLSLRLYTKRNFLFLGKSVMLYAAEMIPKLKTRTQKTGGGDQSLQQGEGSKKGKGKKKKWPGNGSQVCDTTVRDMNGGF